MFYQVQKVNHLYFQQNANQNASRYANQKANPAANKNGTARKSEVASLRRSIRMEQRENQNKQTKTIGNSIIESSLGVADTIRSGRLKSQKTALAVKKVQYNFKSISTKIMRSKTSTSARQVASEARREVLRLKRQKLDKNNDAEELEAAITHAKAMERLAKKKAVHLEEEELAKVAEHGSACLDESEDTKEEMLQEDLESKNVDFTDDESMLELVGEEASQEMSQVYEEMQRNLEELMQNLEAESDMQSDVMESFMDEMNETMKDLLEESGLGDLLEEISGNKYEEMDPADYKMMKIKHRCKELKELAEADSEYLKAIFDQLAKEQGNSDVGGTPDMASMPDTVSMPDAGTMEAPQVHIDITL